jgi:hypothetical protein
MNKSRVESLNDLGVMKGNKKYDGGTIGTMKGIMIKRGLKAEILFTGVDVSSLLDEIIKMEGEKETNDTKLGAFLKMLSERYLESTFIFKFQAQIAANGVEFKPVLKEI